MHEKVRERKNLFNYLHSKYIAWCRCVTCFLLALFCCCSYLPVKAEIVETGYLWYNHFVLKHGEVVSRFITTESDIDHFLYRTIDPSNTSDQKLSIYLLAPEFDTYEQYTTWYAKQSSLWNNISNGYSTTWGNTASFQSFSITYTDVNGNDITKWSGYCYKEINGYYWKGLPLGSTYSYFEGKMDHTSSSSKSIIASICTTLVRHGVYPRGYNLNNSKLTYINYDEYFPFKFGKSNTSGDQRTFDDTTTNIKTINLHPADVFNTYTVNRTVSNTTVDFDTYIMPNATNINGDVIKEGDIKYGDMTENTEYNVTNINNYYADGNENNDGDGDGQGGNVGASGITVTDSFKQQQQQQQTIETGAASATITIEPQGVTINNGGGELTEQQIDRIQEIFGQQEEVSFAQAITKIHDMQSLGKEYMKLTKVYLGFLPEWSLDVIGFAFVILGFMIVIRLFHVLHG